MDILREWSDNLCNGMHYATYTNAIGGERFVTRILATSRDTCLTYLGRFQSLQVICGGILDLTVSLIVSADFFQVHARGSLYASPDELLVEVTGESMRPGALVEHLRSKYSEIYDLQ